MGALLYRVTESLDVSEDDFEKKCYRMSFERKPCTDYLRNAIFLYGISIDCFIVQVKSGLRFYLRRVVTEKGLQITNSHHEIMLK